MVSARYYIIAIAVIGILFLVGSQQKVEAATASEKESLRGLRGIVLKPMMFVSTPAKVNEELPLSDLTKEIEHQFRQSGMLLDEHASEDSRDRPYLEIQGAVTQITTNYYAYTIVVELHQEAILRRNASRPSVVTWSEGTLSTGGIQKFQDRIRLLVRMFIQDFQTMNDSYSPAWSVSWRPSGT